MLCKSNQKIYILKATEKEQFLGNIVEVNHQFLLRYCNILSFRVLRLKIYIPCPYQWSFSVPPKVRGIAKHETLTQELDGVSSSRIIERESRQVEERENKFQYKIGLTKKAL